MHDIFIFRIGRTRPLDIFFAFRQRHSDRMQTVNEFAVAQRFQRLISHSRHQFHINDDIRRIGKLHAELRNRRANRSHTKRHDIHRSAFHRTVEFRRKRLLHFLRSHPVISRSGIAFGETANISSIFDTRHIRRMRTRQKRIRTLFRVEANECSGLHHFFAQAIIFSLRTVAPNDFVRFAKFRRFHYPFN